MRTVTWVLISILITLYIAFALLTTQVLHFSRALDEGYHLELISFIKEAGRLPVTYEERAQMARADLPPLYHLAVAAVTPHISVETGPEFKLFYDSFRYRVVDVQSDQPWTLDTEDLRPPYLGRFLVWQFGRWLSVGLSLATIVVVFFTLQEIPLGLHPLTSIFGAAFLAFIPRYLILSASLNDDSLLGLLAALYFWMLVRFIKSPLRWWPLVCMALALGLATTVKYSLVLVPFEIVVVYGLLAFRQGLGRRWFASRITVVGLLAALVSGWWFGWNIWHFNTIAEDGLVVGITRALFAGGYNVTLNQIVDVLASGKLETPTVTGGAESAPLSRWITVTFSSMWGYQINNQIPLAEYAFPGIGLLGLLAAAGLVRLWRVRPESRRWTLLALFHLVLLTIIPLIRFETSGRIGQTAQGRHILVPAATAIVALLTWGLAAVLPRRWQMTGLGIILAGIIAWSGIHLYYLSIPGTPPLPVRTIAQAADWLPNPIGIRFGDNIELVSAKHEIEPGEGRLNLELAWRSRNYVNENYRLNVMLLDEAGETVSSWLGYNGGGRIPTLAWDPGDSVFDRLTLPLPNLPEGDYRLQVQVLGSSGPVSVNNTDQGDILSLANVSLDQPSTLSFPYRWKVSGPNQFTEVGYTVWRSTGPFETTETPYFRYPDTITIIVDQNEFDSAELKVRLVDSNGREWSSVRAEGNIYTFIVGPRWPSDHYRAKLIIQDNEIMATSVVSDVVLEIENWWERQFDPPAVESPLKANFADQVFLLGYKLPHSKVRAGEAFPITMYWQAPPDSSPQANFIQFNNLVDSSGTSYGGYERRPLEYYSTLLWAPGEVVVDGYAVPVDSEAPPGEYYLDVGFYITVGESAVNLPLVIDNEMSDLKSVTIGPIEVIAD